MKVSYKAKKSFLFVSSYCKHFSRQVLGNPYDSADVLAHLCLENRQVSIRMISALTKKPNQTKKTPQKPPDYLQNSSYNKCFKAKNKKLAGQQMKM